MLGADIYFCNDGGNGSFTVQDSWSVAPQPPPSDVSQGGQDSIIYQHDITSLQNYSTRVLIFSRKLSTGDPFDTDIIHGPMDVIFAFSQSSELAWHGALNRMHSQINFYESSTAIAPSQTSTVSSSLLILHSISMYVAFIILYPLGIYVARYHRNLNRWLSIHTSLLSSVTSNVVVAALTAIIGTFGNTQSVHYKIGMAVIGLVGISSMAGYFATKLYMAHYRWSNLAAVFRYIHKYSGLLAYIVGLVDCYYGVVELSPTASEQVYYQLIFLVTVFIPPIGLYLYGEKQKHLNIDVKDYMGLNNLPLFRWEDVNHRVSLGAKWIVIDDIIYDIQKYMDFHPGGPYALNQMIGIDAAFAFNGRYTKKPLIEKFGSLGRRGANSDDEEDEKLRQQYVVNNPTTYVDEKLEALIYNHSRYARNILSNYAMGTLRDYDPTPRRSSKDVDDVTNSDSMLKESSLELGTSRVKRIPVHVNTFQHYIIGRKTLLTGPNARHPVYLFRLLFDEEDAEMHSRPGDSYLFQFVDDTGKLVSRSYTPIKVDSKGGIDFMIKLYNGEMTHYLSDAKSVRMRGPIPRTDLLNPFSESGCWKTLGLIAGGTGITPMLLIIDYHLKYCSRDPVTNRPNFHIHLLYANLDEKNIFGVKEIGELEERANGAITVTYIVSGIASEEFDGLVGNITPEVLIATMPKPLAQRKKFGLHLRVEADQPLQLVV
ncbi:hypothetical protein BCR33DRAFT_113212 [Rhizoclosmatium globosum]|uniref:Cytochrome b5 heme-binding domain-containing protein n=1 Tax=Rhizoclosmatium globosum TaxID=329046 RepID=A0A1Y2CIT0_9FUNG|nr:hypothetical protein BCR33DRAFT_113212 [Rhizoclosmatium globosum]|eukprot:ORY46932.1 hypothetical protein BCR33DRAFT_113212 [Rhizoclosmatium globosum]